MVDWCDSFVKVQAAGRCSRASGAFSRIHECATRICDEIVSRKMDLIYYLTQSNE